MVVSLVSLLLMLAVPDSERFYDRSVRFDEFNTCQLSVF